MTLGCCIPINDVRLNFEQWPEESERLTSLRRRIVRIFQEPFMLDLLLDCSTRLALAAKLKAQVDISRNKPGEFLDFVGSYNGETIHAEIQLLSRLVQDYIVQLTTFCCSLNDKGDGPSDDVGDVAVINAEEECPLFLWTGSQVLRLDITSCTKFMDDQYSLKQWGIWVYQHRRISGVCYYQLGSRLLWWDLHMMYMLLFYLNIIQAEALVHLTDDINLAEQIMSKSQPLYEGSSLASTCSLKRDGWIKMSSRLYVRAYGLASQVLSRPIIWIKTLPKDHGFGELDPLVIKALSCYTFGQANLVCYRSWCHKKLHTDPEKFLKGGDNLMDIFSSPARGGDSDSDDDDDDEGGLNNNNTNNNRGAYDWRNFNNKHDWCWWQREEGVSPVDRMTKTYSRELQPMNLLKLAQNCFYQALYYLRTTSSQHNLLTKLCGYMNDYCLTFLMIHSSTWLQVKAYMIYHNVDEKPATLGDGGGLGKRVYDKYIDKKVNEAQMIQLLVLSLRAVHLALMFLGHLRVMVLMHEGTKPGEQEESESEDEEGEEGEEEYKKESMRTIDFAERKYVADEVKQILLDIERLAVPYCLMTINTRPCELSYYYQMTDKDKADQHFSETLRLAPEFFQLIILATSMVEDPELFVEKYSTVKEGIKEDCCGYLLGFV